MKISFNLSENLPIMDIYLNGMIKIKKQNKDSIINFISS